MLITLIDEPINLMFLRLFIIAFFTNIFVSTFFCECNAQWDWGWDKVARIPPKPCYFEQKIKSSNSDWTFYSKLIFFYKIKVSPKQGQRCPCYPTCSTYTIYSMQKYGFIWGFIMGIERIYFRETLDIIYRIHYLPVWINGKKKTYDPPEGNFIFEKKDWRIINPIYFNLFFK